MYVQVLEIRTLCSTSNHSLECIVYKCVQGSQDSYIFLFSLLLFYFLCIQFLRIILTAKTRGHQVRRRTHHVNEEIWLHFTMKKNTFVMLFTNIKRESTPPSIKYKGKKHPIKSKVKTLATPSFSILSFDIFPERQQPFIRF